jgi:hypothetical protein
MGRQIADAEGLKPVDGHVEAQDEIGEDEVSCLGLAD